MTAPSFIFATGIENSNPTLKNGTVRVDELEKCGHYEHWQTDFALLQDLDIRFVRYGPPIHRTWLAHDRYDWDFADQTFGLLKRLNITQSSISATSACQTGSGTSKTRIFPNSLPSMRELLRSAFPGCNSTRR